MAVIWVRTFGLPSHCVEKGMDRGDGISITFPEERVRMETVFARLHIPIGRVGLVAINGVKCAKDTWVTDGDKVTIFPFVTGG